MSKINVLSSKIFNRIAAGEVVERPASVVKELVENSIDAGADKINVEIIGGGLTSIICEDNGGGIEKSELNKALLPHATSKIEKITDLDKIMTLGFRGEALASIASVSKMTITSKPSNQEAGASIYSEGGAAGEITDIGTADGTEIRVDNLFFNAPVRAKFLRSERSEEGEISATMARFILGHPDISFKLISDGKTVLSSFGDGIESAFVRVYGVETVDNCFYVDTERNGIKICGYIGKHYFTKSNRSHQTLFLNGRYVVNQTAASAITNAYAPYLMKRQYPFYVLSVDLPSEEVDVNVHPNKIDVRFTNNQIVYGTIYSVISKVLDGSSEALNIVSKTTVENKEISGEKTETVVKENHKSDSSDNIPCAKLDENTPYPKEKVTISNDFNFFKLEDSGVLNYQAQTSKTENKPITDIFEENKKYLAELEKAEKEKYTQNAITVDKELKLIGQALKTFLIFEDGEDLYFIDQHAAHERILFDKFNEQVIKSDVYTQPLLVPFILNVNNYESDFIESNLGAIKAIGIDIEEFGKNSFKVSSVPVAIFNINLQRFFDDIISDITALKSISLSSVLTEKLAQKACKAAIKSGDEMSDGEIAFLLKLLKGNLGLKCPHGRPIAVKITRTEIDKWFKRIV